MNEMINSATSLFPLMTMASKNSLYYNASVFSFSLIATINHISPENLDGLTHFVKLLFSNILFSMMGFNPLIGIALSLSDLTPLFTSNKTAKKYGELFMQVPRLLIEVHFIFSLFPSHTAECLVMIGCKVLYYFERKDRIEKGVRNDFSVWHAGEHIGLYLLFKIVVQSEFSIKICLILLLSHFTFVILFFDFLNYYINKKARKNIPEWVKKDTKFLENFNNKINEKKKSHLNELHKLFSNKLKWEFISFEKLTQILDVLLKSNDFSEYDYIVGISSEVGLASSYISMYLQKPLLRMNEQSAINENYKELAGKRVLLVDDNTTSGIDNKQIESSFIKNGAKTVDTLVMWAKGKNQDPKYYHSKRRNPVFWECE